MFPEHWREKANHRQPCLSCLLECCPRTGSASAWPPHQFSRWVLFSHWAWSLLIRLGGRWLSCAQVFAWVRGSEPILWLARQPLYSMSRFSSPSKAFWVLIFRRSFSINFFLKGRTEKKKEKKRNGSAPFAFKTVRHIFSWARMPVCLPSTATQANADLLTSQHSFFYWLILFTTRATSQKEKEKKKKIT